MHVTKLSLLNFRNFTSVEEVVFPKEGVLMVAAPNATGKTNFLESMVLLVRGKSWRAGTEDCLQWGKNNFAIQGVLTTDDGETHEVSLTYTTEGRKVRLLEDGAPISLVTFYQKYPLIVFLPEDTFLFTRGPEARRNFLNSILISHPNYLAALVQYNRVLKQRNAALKKANNTDELSSWTMLLTQYADTLWKVRRAFVEFIGTHLADHYGQFSQEKKNFKVVLKTQGKADGLLEQFEDIFEQEKRFGHTLLGPHRDDMTLTVNGKEAAVALSQGQTRNVVVALKIIAYHFLQHVTKETPLVLLDEVLSELDEVRQKKLIEHLPHTQVVLTATEVPSLDSDAIPMHYLDLRSILLKAGEPKRLPVQAHA